MVTLGELKVPQGARPYAEKLIDVTDALCLEHLDEEYADLCRRMVGKLARKRPTPLSRGDLGIWASGVIYAVGQVNFLFDSHQALHLSADELSRLLGVKKTTMSNKAKLIRDTLGVRPFDAEFSRQEMIEKNPLTWMLEVDGLVIDARQLPHALQVHVCELGLIPYAQSAGPSPGDG